jgi:DNA adenine methylase
MRIDGLLFSYPGSKWRLAPRYQRYFPRHRFFVDVFGGSAAMISRQAPRVVETYNDLDTSVYLVFAAVKDPTACEEVLRLLESTSNDREQYRACKAVLADPNESSVRRAWAFLVAGTIGFSGHPALANGWTQSEMQRRDLRNLPAKVRWWHDRLQGVCLENRPWQEIVEARDSPDTFFFCDPPYPPGVLRSSAGQYYQHRMGLRAHVELIEKLRTIRGRALLCGYNHPKYTELLFYWRKLTFQTRETMSGKAGRRQEIAWLNYEDDGSKSEGNRLRIAKRYVQIMENEDEAARYVERIKRLRRLLK